MLRKLLPPSGDTPPPTSGRPTQIRNRRSRLASIFLAFAMLFGLGATSVAVATTASVVMASPAHADANSDKINGAIAWAVNEMNSDPTGYYELCLPFVSDAYASVGVSIGSADDPVAYWAKYPALQHPKDTSPPKGALVLWGANSYTSDGHIALAINDSGMLISSYERSNPDIHEFTVADRNNAGYTSSYLGWMMPPGVTQIVATSPPPAPPVDTDGDGIPDSIDQCVETPGVDYQQGCQQPMATYRGDYNGDGYEDKASFYVYPERGNAMALYIWYGDGTGALGSPQLAWYNASGYDSDRVIPAGAGDFNKDGKSDLAMFYRYPDTTVGVLVWYGTASGVIADPTLVSHDTNMEGANLIPVGVGDYNGDGTTDLAALYRYPERGNALSLIVWEGNGTGGFAAGVAKWYNATGWNGHLIVPAGSGDFYADGRTDISVFYNYGGGVVRMLTWYGRADGTFYDPAVTFYAPSGWAGSHLISAGVGDYNGDGKQDVAMFYGYPERGNAVGLFVWDGNGDGTFQGPVLSWYTPSGWWWLNLIPAGISDLNGDGRDEISMFYNYGNNVVRMFTWSPGTDSVSADPATSWYTPSGWAAVNLRP